VVPTTLEAQPVIQAVVYALVGFALVVQAPSLEPLVRLLHGRHARGEPAPAGASADAD
jgi:hypothetical protein